MTEEKKCSTCIISIRPTNGRKIFLEFEKHLDHPFYEIAITCKYCPECGHKIDWSKLDG